MTPEEIERVFRQMHDRLTDVFLRFEALRVTLEQLGSLPPGQFDQNLKALQQKWELSLQTHLIRNLEDENRELMRLLLQLHEGTTQ